MARRSPKAGIRMSPRAHPAKLLDRPKVNSRSSKSPAKVGSASTSELVKQRVVIVRFIKLILFAGKNSF